MNPNRTARKPCRPPSACPQRAQRAPSRRMPTLLALLVLLFGNDVVTAQPTAARYSPQQILQWETVSFSGTTDYRLVERDGQPAVHADCNGQSGSGLALRTPIDLTETPIVEWRWRVDQVYQGLDPHRKDGDDYPARLYVVDEHSFLRWRTRAINYVWANRQTIGSDWPNPFTDKAHMVAVNSGAPATGEDGWQTVRRNIRRDFERYFDRSLDEITAVAIMTDCDNAGQKAEAWYGEIRFLPAD
ncbi:DUF3047 domain-containing protein [Algiphilus sp.]|uniref:DUF3047 domain-containing protein n=1 Tax=Algiphilus sp. TaxID=1872431 RepID=UPI003B525A0F